MNKDLQIQRALKMLKRAKSRGVKNHQFAENGLLRYSSYLKDLRDEGYHIITERMYLPNGRATNIWNYTLIED